MGTSRSAVNSAELLHLAQAGDDKALDALMRLYLPRLRRWAQGRMPARARGAMDTEDVVQETVIAAVRNIGRVEVRGDGALQAYLRAALANRFTDLYRRDARRPENESLDSQLPAPAPSPLEAAIGSEALQRYETALEALSERDRRAVILRIEMCADYNEIADAVEASGPGHARVIVSRALERLARQMHHGR